MNWKIGITGDKFDLESLSKKLTSKDLAIVKENEHFILESEDFDSLSDYTEVKTKVTGLLNLVNISSQLELESKEVIKCNHISLLDENGIERIFIESKVGSFGRAFAQVSIYGGKEKGNTNRNYRKLAEYDENVKDVFDLIVYDFNSFVTFYKIIEILQKDDFKPIKKGGVYFNEVYRFNQSANSYKATGVESRHHLDRNTPPDIPMTLSEAKSLIRKILHEWLDKKEQERLNEIES